MPAEVASYRKLFALLLGACGSTSNAASPDAAVADAGAVDAPKPDAASPVTALERLDYRGTRGEAVPASTVTLPEPAELFAMSDQGFVTRAGCADDQGCTLTWHDLAGAITRERGRLVAATLTTVSPDGRRALYVAADEDVASCLEGDVRHTVVRGTLQLLDLATGEATYELELRSNLWSLTAFMPGGDWFLSAPIAGDACQPQRFVLRAVAPPFAPAPGLADDLSFVDAADARRWFVYRDADLGVIDPAVAGSFDVLGRDPEPPFGSAGGWYHAYVGFAELAQEVKSIGPAGEHRTTSLRDEDWFGVGSWGRWVRVCGVKHTEGYRDCRVVDVLAETTPVELRVMLTPDHPDDTVLLPTISSSSSSAPPAILRRSGSCRSISRRLRVGSRCSTAIRSPATRR